MTLNRRDFVSGVGWAAVATAGARTAIAQQAAHSAVASAAAAPAAVVNYADWAVVKEQFRLDPRWLHLSQFFMVSHPRPVRAAIERLRDKLDANPFATVEQGMGFGDQPGTETYPAKVEQAAARYLGGQPDEVALTDSTTQGLALVYNGLSLRPGDEILTTTHDHYVHHEAIRFAAERSGASSRRIALYDAPAAASADEMAERLRAAIRPHTRIVGLTWVHSCSGVKVPVRAMADVIAQANRNRDEHDHVLMVLDGAHGFGNQPEAAAGLGCDFIAMSGHKWIFAPRGTGLLWAPARNWPLLRPTIPTFYAPEPFQAWEDGTPPGPTRAAWVSPGGFKAYEHQWAMTEAFEFHGHIGRERAAARIAALNTQCKEGLARIPGVSVLTPMAASLSAGIICFEVRGQTPQQTVSRLLQHKVIASSSPYKVSYARLAPSLVNDEREVDAAVRAVREIA